MSAHPILAECIESNNSTSYHSTSCHTNQSTVHQITTSWCSHIRWRDHPSHSNYHTTSHCELVCYAVSCCYIMCYISSEHLSIWQHLREIHSFSQQLTLSHSNSHMAVSYSILQVHYGMLYHITYHSIPQHASLCAIWHAVTWPHLIPHSTAYHSTPHHSIAWYILHHGISSPLVYTGPAAPAGLALAT